MCDFCDGSHKKIELNVSGEGFGTTTQNMRTMAGAFLTLDDKPPVDYIYLNGSTLMAQTSSGEYRDLGTVIRYCPFCGRKL